MEANRSRGGERQLIVSDRRRPIRSSNFSLVLAMPAAANGMRQQCKFAYERLASGQVGSLMRSDQEQHRLFDVSCNFAQETGSESTVDDPMVAGQGHGH